MAILRSADESDQLLLHAIPTTVNMSNNLDDALPNPTLKFRYEFRVRGAVTQSNLFRSAFAQASGRLLMRGWRSRNNINNHYSSVRRALD